VASRSGQGTGRRLRQAGPEVWRLLFTGPRLAGPGRADARWLPQQHLGFHERDRQSVFKLFYAQSEAQITELLTQYHPAVLWFDTPEKISAAESQELVDLIRKREPNCIINSRVGHGLGDYGVQEQKIPGAGDLKPWETCMTLNGHWGFFLGDEKWKSPETVIHNLVDIVSKGGNYLLNVGPTGAGIIPNGAVEDLNAVGMWMKINGELIYGTKASSLKTQPSWGRVTQNSDFFYLHVFDWPKNGKLAVPELGWQQAPMMAHLLADKTKNLKLTTDFTNKTVVIDLPPQPPDPIDSVVVLVL
jgi:alpha-L-fucosidase